MKLGTAQFLDISPPTKVHWLMNCFVCNRDRAIYTSDLFDAINATHFPEIRRKLCAQAVVFIRSFLFPLLLWNVDVIEWQSAVFHCEPLLLCDVNIFILELSRVLCALENTRASGLDCNVSAERVTCWRSVLACTWVNALFCSRQCGVLDWKIQWGV